MSTPFCGIQKGLGRGEPHYAVVGKALYICMALCSWSLVPMMVLLDLGTGTFLIMGFIFTGFGFLHASANAESIKLYLVM